jgi:hypothetical protein
MAIKDWKVKKEIVRIAFGQMRQNDVPDMVMDANTFDESKYGFAWDSLLEMYGHRFDKPRINVGPNSKYRIFFAELSEQLGCNEVLPGTNIIEGSALDFVKTLPKITTEKLISALNQGGIQLEFREAIEALVCTQLPVVVDDSQVSHTQQLNLIPESIKLWYPIYFTPNETLPTIQEGLSRGHIDQSLYYQNTEAVTRWFSITNDEFYTGFDQCKTGLLKLSRDSQWIDFTRDADCDGIVMLCGGGAHSKDAVLIKCLLDGAQKRQQPVVQDKKMRYTLIDRSSAMLEVSRSKIAELLDKRDGHDFIEIKALRRDVMSMNGSEPVRGDGKLAWFNTGGTLGNLDEEQFFASLNQTAQKDDLLILGVSCIDDDGEFDLAALAKEYERDVVKDFVAVPLSAVWSTLSVDEKPEDVISSIVVEAVPNKLSAVQDSITVVAKLPSDTMGEIILFKSSRYKESSLIDFVRSYDWEHVVSIDGLDGSFKQLMFKKIN